MSERCDLVLFGSVIVPEALTGGPRADFVALRGDQIVAVGHRSESDEWVANADRVVDVGQAAVTAGLVDAHIHPIAGFDMTRGADLTGLRTWAQVREALLAEVNRTPEGWVLGWGLDPTAFEERPLSHEILDGIADGRLVNITLFDAHGAVASRAALELAGVTGNERFNDASRVGVGADGHPNGVLYEGSAQALVSRMVPESTFEERVVALISLLEGMAEAGLTGGQMLDFAREESLELLEEVERRGELPIRLRVSPWVLPGDTEVRLAELAALQGQHGRRWEVRGIKLMVDGTVDNGTAWLFEPDTEGQSTASLWLDPAGYQTAVAYFDERDIPTTTHAIGDQAVSFVARTIAQFTTGRVAHRIEHIETIPDEVIRQIVDAGASTSMQPTHCTHFSTADHSDNWSRRLGRDRAERGWRIRDLRDAGAVVALGSDWPVAPYDPREIIASARLRRRAGAVDQIPITPAQTISAARALEGYTSQYWRSVGEAGGEIVQGGRGDLTVFAVDPLEAGADDFAAGAVLLTVVGGEIVVDATRSTAMLSGD